MAKKRNGLSDAQYQKMYGRPRKSKTTGSSSGGRSSSSSSSSQQANERGRARTARTNAEKQRSYTPTRTTTVHGRGDRDAVKHTSVSSSSSNTYSTSRNVGMNRTQGSSSNTDRTSAGTATRAKEAWNRLEEDRKRREEESRARRNQKMTGGVTKADQQKTRKRFATAREMMADRAKEAQKTKMGAQVSEEEQTVVDRALRNTPALAKKAIMDTVQGHGKTIADLTELTASNKNGTDALAMKMGIQDDPRRRRELEKQRQETVKKAREDRERWQKEQDKRQAAWDKKTKNAKGFEKAYYGAVESGIGMLTDTALGLGNPGASLVAMGSRTYGSTRGQARKEGATEKEDRIYSLLQAGKEVGTELMFPGVGLASRAYGRAGLPLAEKAANALTRSLRGRTADVTRAGLRLLGGTVEENAEEIAGWGLDPLIKEFTYGRNVRRRDAKETMNRVSDSIRSNIQSEEDAVAASAYLSSASFLDETKREYMAEGMSEADAEEVAQKMRDFLTASLVGDTDTMERLEDEVSKKVAGTKLDWDWKELGETIASTTLLTGVTGLPGAITTAARGAAIRDELGTDGIRALANTAIDFEDKKDSYKGQAARDRIDSGAELTSTQVYDLAEAMQKQTETDNKRNVASKTQAIDVIENEKLVIPYGVNQNNGNLEMDDVVADKYESDAREASNTIRSYESTSEGSESLTDTEVRNGSKAIAGFKSGIFTVEDANELNYRNTAVRSAFEYETGVNLEQYVVKNKDGTVNVSATNAATKDALFAMASDNLVESARVATANWMDNVKGEVVTQVTARMGAQGSVVFQAALDDVDERNRSEYMMVANASDMLYQSARNMGTEWDNVKDQATKMFPQIAESKLEAMYNAGLEDRRNANDILRNRSIHIGNALTEVGEQERSPEAGRVYVDTETSPKGTVVRAFSELASNLGVDIHLVDNIETASGKQANGYYINGAIYINVNSDFEQNMGYIFMHEVTHHLKMIAPKEYAALENLVREKWFEYDDAQMQNEIARKIQSYADAGQTLTEEKALEEIIADAAHEFLNDPNFANQVAEENPTLAKAILNSIRNALRMLRRVLATGSIDDETHMDNLFSQLDIFDEAEKLWLNAYTAAYQNKAALAIDNWQDEVNERYSTAETNLSDSKQITWDEVEQRQSFEDALRSDPRFADFVRYDDLVDERDSIVNAIEGEGTQEQLERLDAIEEELREIVGDNGYFETTRGRVVNEIRNEWLAKSDENMTVTEGTARWTDSRIDSLIREYGASNQDYSQAWAVIMSPADFLKLTLPEETLQKWEANPNEEVYDLDEEKLMREGQTPFLIIDGREDVGDFTYRIDGHEGRHRMRALMRAGVTSVPVALKETQTTKYSKTPVANMTLAAQDFGYDPINNDARVEISDLVPIKESNRDELIEKFGGDADVRFSISEQQDSDYMSAVESGDMETAQRMVDEVAKQKGYTPRLYHGSSAFGFTEFDLNKMDDKTSIFLTDNEEIASTYSGKPGSKAINERSNLDYANMSMKDIVDSLNGANISVADEAVSYDYYDAGRIEALKSEIDSGLNKLSEIVDSKVTEYAERMAEDFNDTDMKTHKQLVQLKKKLDLYKEVQEGKRKVSNPDGLYIEFSTPTYLLLNNTDAFDNVDYDVKSLEENIRLFDLLNNEMNRGEASKSADNWQNYFDAVRGEGFIVERALDGYHLEYVPRYEAINKLRSAVDAGNYALYAKLENPLVIDADGAYWKSIPVPRELLSSFADDYHSHADGNMVMNFEDGRTVTNTRSLASYAKRAGYDGVIFNNLKDHGGLRYDEVSHDLDANIYIAFDPNAVASADPVTYDDEGNVIPLSQRFDMQNPDIRYSLDSEGTELSQGQETFFERSKNRNAEGQLKVMLHGTDADFTEFDPSKARPGTLGRAFYFSDSAAHAGQYGNVGRYYLNLENPLTGNTHDITKDQLRRFVAELAENEDYGIENYGADATVDSVTDSVWGGTDFVMLRDLNLSAVGDFAEAVKVFNRVNGTDYDGIITDVETAAFYPEQIKRTDNLNPTLSKDTRYSITDAEGRDLSDGQVSYFRNSQARDEKDGLLRLYHGTGFAGFNTFKPGLIWLTTSRRDADAYGGNWEHKLYDPNETVNTEPIVAGDYNLGDINSSYAYMRFDTEADREQFIADHPDIENAHSFEELDDLNFAGEIDDAEFDRLLKANEQIVNDYSKYEAKHSRVSTWGEVLDNPEKFSKRDLARAMLAYDSNAAIDEEQEDTKEDLLEAMKYIANEYEAESGETLDNLRGIEFTARVPVGEASEYVHTVNNRTYEVYANVVNPLIVDMEGKAMEEGGYAYVDEMRNNDAYDGIIIKNTSVGRYHDPQTIVIAKESNQVKLTSNENPTTDPDIRYSLSSTGKELSEGQANYFANSQARDEQGRLVPVYHTTNKGGFTIFDPSYSDDHRSLFFASNFAVSQTYGRHANRSILGSAKYKSFDDIEEDFINNNWRLMPDYLDSGFDKNNIVKHYKIKVKRKGSILKGRELGANDTARFREWLRLSETNDEKASQYQVEFKPIGESQTQTVDSLSEMIDYFNKNAPLPSRGYYECYLNLENPLIVDAKGHLWREIPYGPAGDSLYDHKEKLKESSNLLIHSVRAIQDDYDDEGIPHTIDIEIKYMSKKPDGGWYLPSKFKKQVSTDASAHEDPAEASMAIWTKAEDAMKEWGLPADYINDLEIEHVNYEGDIVWTEAERPESVQFDYINTEEGTYEIIDPYDYADDTATYTTRELAEIAQNEGYDGVIIKNCADIGGSSKLKGNAMSDIYIAFSSNQVKDVNNLNPTENPDIRYSITPEDEVKSTMAYEDAVDESYEQIARYEAMLDGTSEDFEYTRPIPEGRVSAFYAGLTNVDSRVYSDVKLEEDAVRMARSKNDFYNHLNAKWQDRWTTEGEVLDIKSVKTNVRNLVMGVMQNSASDSKYKSDLVKKTLLDMKTAYQLMKQDRTDVASALLYYSAQRMIDNVEFYTDGTFDQYKKLRDYLRQTKISLGEEYWSDVDYDAFRKANFGRLKLVKGTTNVDQVYQELEEMFPEWFNEEENMTIPDQLLQIDHVLDAIQPYKEAYSSEEAASLAFDIADDLYEIMVNGEELASLADRYKQSYEAKVDAMKQRHAEAMLRMRKARDIGVLRERAKWRAREMAKKEKANHRKHYERIQKNYDWLVQRVLDPTKDKNVPEEFRQSLAEMLQTLDMQTEASKKLEAKTGHVANKTFKMREFKDRLNEMATKKGENGISIFELDENVGFLMDALVKKLDGQSVDALDTRTITEVDKVLAAIRGAMARQNKIRIDNKSQEISEIAGGITEDFLSHVEKFGRAKKYEGIRGGMNAINTASLTPVYFFERLGKFNQMYEELRYGGFDTYVRNEKFIIERLKEITKPYYKEGRIRKSRPKPGSELEKWRDSRSAQTFTLTHGSITLSAAQMMSLYCLSKRPQAMQHMLSMNGGIVATAIDAGSKIEKARERFLGKTETNQKVVVTEADIQTIIEKLTPEQMSVADQLQELMSVDMARLGNEAHREMYGYDVFEDPNYFPIKVHGNEVATDINDLGDVIQKIKSFGPAKPLDPNANNLIEIDDIFSVTADHCNGMNLYNAFLVPISDFMRVYNYKQYFDDGKDAITVKDALEAAHGKRAMDYILNFMKDINGIKPDHRGGLEDVINKALGTAKKTAVFGNIRVALQQPTAIVRALAELDAKYLTPLLNVRPEKGVMEEMWNYCPIAYWKSLGFYDAYMGRDIEDVMMNNWSVADAALSGVYGELDNWTWSLIWRGVKAEQAAAHPEMDTKSEEFLQLCGRRASEVFDKTQVVDSTFHRSDAMRSKQIAIKSLTAFMAEPTLTLNVFRAGWHRATDAWMNGEKGKAAKIFNRALSVIIAQAALVSVAQAVADAWRGKDPDLPWDDDDDDEKNKDRTYMDLLVRNMVANFFDNLHLENNIYLVKDGMPLFNYIMSRAGDYNGWNETFRFIMGWDQEYLYSNSKLIYAGGENIAKGIAEIYKKLEKGDEYIDYNTGEPKSWYDIIQKTASGVGTFTGLPFGTLMRDFKPLLEKAFAFTFAADGSDMDTALSKKITDWTGAGNGKGSDDGGKSDGKGSKSSKSSDGSDRTSPDLNVTMDGYMTDAELKQDSKDKLAAVKDKVEGLPSTEKNQAIFDKTNDLFGGYTNLIEKGRFNEIERMRSIIEAAGGNVNDFDAKVLAKSKTAYKKTLGDSMKLEQQWATQDYLKKHGVSDEEISQLCYKSYTKSDLVYCWNNGYTEAAEHEMFILASAGMTEEDFAKAYKYRNRQRSYNGKYTDEEYVARWTTLQERKTQSTGKFTWPTDGIITSDFGGRESPGGIGSTNHQGIDIGASTGTPACAADGGEVIMAEWYGGYGNTVQIKHKDGTVTQYSHLNSINCNVGDRVAQGAQVGEVGSTGNSTGAHLHFGVMIDGYYVDPLEYLDASGKEWNLNA